MRTRLLLPLLGLILLLLAAIFVLPLFFSRRSSPPASPAAVPSTPAKASRTNAAAATGIYAHNLMLRKGPDFRVYVRWIRGNLTRTSATVNPSFDDPESFFLDIKTGVLRANIGDIANYLNAGVPDSPLKNISLSGDADRLKLRGTLHKGIPLPIELAGLIAVNPDDRIRLHVDKISVLKIPVRGLLGAFRVQLSDLFKPAGIPGIEVKDNDVFFDTRQLLPPPHIRGDLTQVRIANPDLEEVYGNAQSDVSRVEQWRNFLRLRGGTLDFGKLTMRNVDLVMIDLSNDAWFDLDLNNYQAQLVNGYTHMTPQAGLQIFMPDLRNLPAEKTRKNISLEWLKNRNVPPPSEVYGR